MNVKNNARAQSTRLRIRNSFLELLEKKPIEETSVSELCKLADINRSTFYAYYPDLYHLLEYLHDDLLGQFLSRIRKRHNGSEIADSDDVMLYLYFVKENEKAFRVYFKNTSEFGYPKDFRKLLRQSIRYYVQKKNPVPEQIMDRVLDYYEAGVFAVIRRWVLDGLREPPELIGHVVHVCVTNQLL